MTTMPREVRQERIERDGGDPGDTVFATRRCNAGSSYHEDSTCRAAPEQEMQREWTRERAQRRGRAPCKDCVLGERRPSRKGNRDAYNALVEADPDEVLGGDA